MTPKRVPTRADDGRFLYWTAALSCAATVGHVIDTPDHLKEWWGYGTFFVVVAAIQLFYGIALLFRPWRYDESGGVRRDSRQYARPYYVLGITLSASVLVLYLVSRTTGMPFFGPDAAVEPVTPLSLVPIAVEAVLTGCLVVLLRYAGAVSQD